MKKQAIDRLASGRASQVTDEMREAGANRLADLLDGGADLTYVAEEVFLAMLVAAGPDASHSKATPP